MVNNQVSSSDIIDNSLPGDKPCAGRDCNNAGIYRLSIIYINKIGYFCLDCKNELERCGLLIKPHAKEFDPCCLEGGDKIS